MASAFSGEYEISNDANLRRFVAFMLEKPASLVSLQHQLQIYGIHDVSMTCIRIASHGSPTAT